LLLVAPFLTATFRCIPDAAGKPADDFRCDVIVLVGDSLAD